MRLQGAKALVTGAAQGLGKAFSEVLLRSGASVCLSDVLEKKGKEVEKEFQVKYGKDKAFFVKCDVRSEEHLTNMFDKAVSKFGQIDLLVNNAGIANESQMKNMIDINLFGLMRATQLAVERMRKDNGGNGGVVVNISSTAGLTPVYFSPSYSATKHGVLAFTTSCATDPHSKEMAIQFATLCPAFTGTALMNAKKEDNQLLYFDEATKFIEKVGIMEISDVAEAFLILVEADDCNGDVMAISKGKGIQYILKNSRRVRSKL